MKKLFKISVSKVYIAYLLFLTVIVIGTFSSYAYFTINKEKKNAIKMVTGNLIGELKIDGVVNDKLVVNGKESKTFKVELINKNTKEARFNFYYKGSLPNNVEVGYIEGDGLNNLPTEKGINLKETGPLGYYAVFYIKVVNNTTDTVTIPLGYSVGLDYNDLTLPNDCHLFSKKKEEPKVPKLASNMIPVRYDGSNWVKAETYDWYDYDKQEWANAVTVSSDVRDSYIKASAGTTIEMDKINTMWVWIPRYSYTIGSEDGTNYYGKKGEFLDTTPTKALPGEIDVKFVDTNTNDRGTAKYKVSDGVSGWYTPDAFTFGEEDLEGVWIGKFETSNKEGTYESDSSTLTPIIKPKVTSWRSIKVSTLETVSMNMNKTNNIYGFQESEVDTHAIKGSEWAIVAYLSQSKYGKLGNRSYSGVNKEVYINNYNGFQTGCSSGETNVVGDNVCDFSYDELEDRGGGLGSGGGGASTTGNIYGIYDMNGGAWEYAMTNFNGYTGSTKELNSGYSGLLTNGEHFDGISFPEQKYYDKYSSTDINIISHALGETAGWYEDQQIMITSASPWQLRGGLQATDASKAGLFYFNIARLETGSISNLGSFRLALTNK